jgi:predicted Zn-dependent protease
MKAIIIIKIILVTICWPGVFSGIRAQENIYMQAMQEEVQRGMEGLILDRMLPPGFISYHIVDANILHVGSVLGGIVRSQERRLLKFDNRTLVINEGTSNENFLDMDNLWSWSRQDDNIPITGSTDDVRRALWLATDNNYKTALSTYESKLSAMRQQNLSPEERALTDFLPAEKQEITIPYKAMDINKNQLENLTATASSVFAAYANIISSQVNIYVYDGQVFYHNSEGSMAQYPFQVAAVVATASAQAGTGEMLYEHYIHFASNVSELPAKETLVAEVHKIAGYLNTLSGTQAVAEPYSGPVLFEGQAVAELFSQVLFGDVDGLIAVRKPIIGNEQILRYAPDRVKENSLEARIGRRIISRDLSIEALPKLTSFQGTNLFGSYQIDAEGLPALDTVSLVANGILNSVLSSRVPTLRVQESNAHARLGLSMGSVRTVTAPGVIKMSAGEEASYSAQELREMLLREAEDEGLDYAYIVRKVVSPAARFAQDDGFIIMGQPSQKKELSKTIRIYRIYVEDGREEPVSLAEIKGLNIRSLRRILGASQEMQVYNTMFSPATTQFYTWGFELTGVPVSYIVPTALLFEELDVVRETQQVVKKAPVVENPVNIPR